MEYIINGGRTLRGELPVYGAKNCALALLGATVLTDDEVILFNCPNIVDVSNMIKLLQSMGKTIVRNGDTLSVKGGLGSVCAPSAYATLLRGSALVLGSSIARYHRIALPLPGGCAIGARPMDIHLDGLQAMGIDVLYESDMVSCAGIPVGTDYKLRFASVGATENLLCASVLARGNSVLRNVAIEPEVVALEQMLVRMGARISGIGTDTISVEGVRKLHGADFAIIPDRIVAATYLSAAVATRGEVTLTHCRPDHLRAFLDVLQPHCSVRCHGDAIRLSAPEIPCGYGEIVTAPYPLFPTDMQSLMLSLAACSRGKTIIRETLFENRLAHNAAELRKMGADIVVSGNTATVAGKSLHGADVIASDLRGGAGLVLAALASDGTSTVRGVEHIDRGYADLALDLNKLGADIVCKEA